MNEEKSGCNASLVARKLLKTIFDRVNFFCLSIVCGSNFRSARSRYYRREARAGRLQQHTRQDHSCTDSEFIYTTIRDCLPTVDLASIFFSHTQSMHNRNEIFLFAQFPKNKMVVCRKTKLCELEERFSKLNSPNSSLSLCQLNRHQTFSVSLLSANEDTCFLLNPPDEIRESVPRGGQNCSRSRDNYREGWKTCEI